MCFLLAEIAAEFLKKGSKVYVEGALRTRQWEQDGVKRYATEIIGNEMQMLDSRGSADTGANSRNAYNDYSNEPQSSAQPSTSSGGGQAESTSQQGGDFADFDDDIPF